VIFFVEFPGVTQVELLDFCCNCSWVAGGEVEGQRTKSRKVALQLRHHIGFRCMNCILYKVQDRLQSGSIQMERKCAIIQAVRMAPSWEVKPAIQGIELSGINLSVSLIKDSRLAGRYTWPLCKGSTDGLNGKIGYPPHSYNYKLIFNQTNVENLKYFLNISILT